MGAVCASIAVDRLRASGDGEMRRNEGRERNDCSLVIPHYLSEFASKWKLRTNSNCCYVVR